MSSSAPDSPAPVPDRGRQLLAGLWAGLGGPPEAPATVALTGPAITLPSIFDVTTLATASIAAAVLAVADLAVAARGGPRPSITVDRRQAAAAFRSERYLEPIGWELPPIWDPIAGDYRTSDGWIRLHTNYRYHRDAALAVLGVAGEREPVTKEVERWTGDELEAAVVDAGGCGAFMRTADEWRRHPQGQAVGDEPVVHHRAGPPIAPRPVASTDAGHPLAGTRVLDLTRVIAGPVCTRVLAAYGADVLRIDPRGFDEVPALLGDTTAGKRRTGLDLTDTGDRAIFEGLLVDADVIVHGYRSDALARLGYETDRLWSLNPRLVITAHDAYGWSGPWATRRGFDSLVQMSCGIAARGQEITGSERPHPLPAQALDHATGYLLAAATCRSLTAVATGGGATESRLSLARTARLLTELGETGDPDLDDFTAVDADPWLETGDTAFGPVRRVSCPGRIDGVEPIWTHPAGPLGIDEPRWPATRGA
jgi:hypothetical protein